MVSAAKIAMVALEKCPPARMPATDAMLTMLPHSHADYTVRKCRAGNVGAPLVYAHDVACAGRTIRMGMTANFDRASRHDACASHEHQIRPTLRASS